MSLFEHLIIFLCNKNLILICFLMCTLYITPYTYAYAVHIYIRCTHMHSPYTYAYIVHICIRCTHMHSQYTYAYAVHICIRFTYIHTLYTYTMLIECLVIKSLQKKIVSISFDLKIWTRTVHNPLTFQWSSILRVRQIWDMIWSLRKLAVWFQSNLIGQ